MRMAIVRATFASAGERPDPSLPNARIALGARRIGDLAARIGGDDVPSVREQLIDRAIHDRHRQDRAGRGADRLRTERVGAAGEERDAVRIERGGQPDDRADVAGILHAVQRDHDRRLAREERLQIEIAAVRKARSRSAATSFPRAHRRSSDEKSTSRVDDLDRLPSRRDRVGDRFRSFDHDLAGVIADGFADALEPGVLPAADRHQLECALLAAR